jgi:membrane protein implicated in regulation of membrane protease activity
MCPAGVVGKTDLSPRDRYRSRMKKVWSSRIVLRYALLQVPAFALLIFLLILTKHWVDLPSWFIWGLIVFWAVKDVVLFPLTWRAYDQDRSRAASSMIGAHGVAEERLAHSGYVRIGGELWQNMIRCRIDRMGNLDRLLYRITPGRLKERPWAGWGYMRFARPQSSLKISSLASQEHPLYALSRRSGTSSSLTWEMTRESSCAVGSCGGAHLPSLLKIVLTRVS